MKNINKKIIIIIIGILAIAIIMVIALLIKQKVNKSSEEEINKEPSLHLYTHQVIDIENLETSLYKDSMNKLKKYKIASKYKVGGEATTIDANVDMYLEDNMAKAIYIRNNDTNLNIVQLKKEITHNEEEPEIIQIEEFMRQFEMECKSNMGGMDLEKEPNEVSISDEKTTYSEQIYNNKELYSARYIVEDDLIPEEEIQEIGLDKSEYTKTYDINFYMDGEYTLVCEFVRIL